MSALSESPPSALSAQPTTMARDTTKAQDLPLSVRLDHRAEGMKSSPVFKTPDVSPDRKETRRELPREALLGGPTACLLTHLVPKRRPEATLERSRHFHCCETSSSDSPRRDCPHLIISAFYSSYSSCSTPSVSLSPPRRYTLISPLVLALITISGQSVPKERNTVG